MIHISEDFVYKLFVGKKMVSGGAVEAGCNQNRTFSGVSWSA